MSIETAIDSASYVGDTGQPYPYARVELVEPDWTRFPGWRDVTAEEWASVQWQRAHCVKNVKQLRELMGDLLDERFYADLERDQAERATMSMLVPPQMMNTMAPDVEPAGAGSLTEAFYADPVRNYMIPVFSDRRTDWASHPHATRDSLHEHDMWATEGLTHRYPTKVLAELLPTCPQYCGHCTRMDLVGNSTAVIDKLKFVGKPNDRLGDMLDYLRRTPSVRDVVVSGGDVANMPWPRLEAFITDLLEIENIRDIRLATKALMALPQHWLQTDVVDGMGRVASIARARGVSIAIHTHVNHANSVTPLVAEATRAMLDTGIRDVRNQGVLMNGVNADPHTLLDLCFRAARWRADHALLLLHVRHDPVLGALARLGRRRPAAAAPHHGLPAGLRDAAHRLRRAVRRQALGPPARRLRHRARHLVLDQELPHLHRGRRPRGAEPDLRVLRPDPHPAPRRPGLVGAARPPRRVRPQGRRGRRGLPPDGRAPGSLRFVDRCGLVTNRRSDLGGCCGW